MRKVLALRRLADSNIQETTLWMFACISLLGHKIQMHEKNTWICVELRENFKTGCLRWIYQISLIIKPHLRDKRCWLNFTLRCKYSSHRLSDMQRRPERKFSK